MQMSSPEKGGIRITADENPWIKYEGWTEPSKGSM